MTDDTLLLLIRNAPPYLAVLAIFILYWRTHNESASVQNSSIEVQAAALAAITQTSIAQGKRIDELECQRDAERQAATNAAIEAANRIDALRDEIVAVKKSAQQHEELLSAKLSALQAKVKQLEVENEKLHQLVAEKNARIDDLLARVRNLEEEGLEKDGKIAELEKANREANSQLSELRAKVNHTQADE